MKKPLHSLRKALARRLRSLGFSIQVLGLRLDQSLQGSLNTGVSEPVQRTSESSIKSWLVPATTSGTFSFSGLDTSVLVFPEGEGKVFYEAGSRSWEEARKRGATRLKEAQGISWCYTPHEEPKVTGSLLLIVPDSSPAAGLLKRRFDIALVAPFSETSSDIRSVAVLEGAEVVEYMSGVAVDDILVQETLTFGAKEYLPYRAVPQQSE